MKALLFTIGIALIIVTAGENDIGTISITQIAVRALIGLALMGISLLIPECEYKNVKEKK